MTGRLAALERRGFRFRVQGDHLKVEAAEHLLRGKLDLAMQLILTPMILQLMERSRRAGGPRRAS